MQITRIRALRGPNLWSHHTAIQAVVTCHADECSINTLSEFETRVRARFPEIASFQPIGHDDAIPLVHMLELAETLCQSTWNDTPFDLSAALEQLRELDENVRCGWKNLWVVIKSNMVKL